MCMTGGKLRSKGRARSGWVLDCSRIAASPFRSCALPSSCASLHGAWPPCCLQLGYPKRRWLQRSRQPDLQRLRCCCRCCCRSCCCHQQSAPRPGRRGEWAIWLMPALHRQQGASLAHPAEGRKCTALHSCQELEKQQLANHMQEIRRTLYAASRTDGALPAAARLQLAS
jgi:hypothetical protein